MHGVPRGSLKNPSSDDLARLATLSIVSNHLTGSLKTEEILRSILQSVVEAFGADRGFVRLFGPGGDVTQNCFLDVNSDSQWESFTFTSTLLKACVESLSSVLVIDTDEVAPSQSVMISGIRSVMLCPLVVGERLLGVIYLDSLVKAGCFEENDLKLFSVLAEMISVAVDRNRQVLTVARQSQALDQAHAQLDMTAEETIRQLSLAAEFRDGETSQHLTRVSEYAEAVGLKLGLDKETVYSIKVASLLHDIGKLGIPDAVLLKPGRFTDYERSVMQKHTLFGARILAGSKNNIIGLAAEIALRHHEKWDGSGYPDGISGADIPLAARIVAIADVFDAVSSARRYKDSYSLNDSFSLLQKEAGSHFDPDLISAFLSIRSEIEAIWNGNLDPEDPSSKSKEEKPETHKTDEERVDGHADSARILILDADPYQREVISTEATRRGMRVRECSEANAAEVLIEEEAPDLVILELVDLGAEDLLARLSSSHPSLPILVLTRDGHLARRLTVANYENCSFLHKPLPPAAILDEVEERLPVTEQVQSFTVLAFDDDKVVLTVVSRVLQRFGYRVLTVSDPLDFWEMLTEHAPDILLLDLEMPKVNGFDICKVLRADVEFRHLPIVVLTSHEEISEYQKALEAGADDVLSKPFHPDRLMSIIKSRMSRNRALRISGSRDPLTGFMHRKLAIRMAEQLFASALRQKIAFSVCRLKIEHFEQLIEQQGWQSSANILRQVAELLTRSCRPEDVITRCRDHSLLLILQAVDKDGAEKRVTSLNTKLSHQQGTLGAVRCVGRIASIPAEGNDLKSLLESVGFSYNASY